jgi:Ca2+/Na+ antiporter
MKQLQVGRYILLAIVGLVIFGMGLVLIKSWPDVQGFLKPLPYLLVGVGAGIFGGNLGTALRNRAALKDPQAAKQFEIDEKDERNEAIRNKAKARAYDLMIFVFSAILLAFALMDVDLYIILILVGIYAIFACANVFYLIKYQKEM